MIAASADTLLTARRQRARSPPLGTVALPRRCRSSSREWRRSHCATRAEARALVWRSGVVAMLLAFLGRIPVHSLAWVVPSTLAAPLVVRSRAGDGGALLGARSRSHVAGIGARLMLFAVYLVGVARVAADRRCIASFARESAPRA